MTKITIDSEAVRQAAQLCEWIALSPHQRGSVNGQAAQVGYALRAALQQPEPQAQAEPEVVAWCVLEPWLTGKFEAQDCFSDVALDANVGWVPLITLQSHREAMAKLEAANGQLFEQGQKMYARIAGLEHDTKIGAAALLEAYEAITAKDAALKACVDALRSAAPCHNQCGTLRQQIDAAITQAQEAMK